MKTAGPGNRAKEASTGSLTLAERRALVRTARRKKKPHLSPRELEFIKLARGYEEFTYVEVAAHMGVHPRTVDGFRECVFQKFGIKSKTGLVLFAMKWGIVKP